MLGRTIIVINLLLWGLLAVVYGPVFFLKSLNWLGILHTPGPINYDLFNWIVGSICFGVFLVGLSLFVNLLVPIVRFIRG